MLLQQISCENAVECAQIANTQETLVVNGIVFVTLIAVT